MNDDTTASALVETPPSQAAPLAQAADTAWRTASDNVGLTLIGGLAIGFAVGALLPLGRRKRPKQAARALAATLAATVSELTHTLAAQARDRAESVAGDASEKMSTASRAVGKSLHDQTESLGKQAKKLADDTSGQLNHGGKAIARSVVNLVKMVSR